MEKRYQINLWEYIIILLFNHEITMFLWFGFILFNDKKKIKCDKKQKEDKSVSLSPFVQSFISSFFSCKLWNR